MAQREKLGEPVTPLGLEQFHDVWPAIPGRWIAKVRKG